jgi:DNA mismatch endonuclease (patch repair protein)
VNVPRLVTTPGRGALMRRVRREGTPAEDRVAALCRELGFYYRRNVRCLPGSPDLANKSKRWAVFVNGCFWHRHTGCKRAAVPKRNHNFWIEKFAANRRRDASKARLLRAAGYRVVLVWECEADDEARLRRRLSNLRKPRIV